MSGNSVLFRALIFLIAVAWSGLAAAQAGQTWRPIVGDDGKPVLNHPIPVELGAEIERLPGVVIVGNPKGDVTLAEFYDLNCPLCRIASADVAELIRSDSELKVILVPFPVLGIPSIQASRVELAVAKLGTPQRFYEFHRRIYAGRGVINGSRALATARELKFDINKIVAKANEDSISEIMVAHVRLANALDLAVTPAFVIKGTAILGHPGRQSFEKIIESVRRCDDVVC